MISLEHVNFRHLFYFWRVARTGHLTRTAEALHISQSALSTQIRQLEARLGVRLFERTGRQLELTDAGRLVLSYAEDMFGLGAEMLGRLSGSEAATTHIRVGSVSNLSRNFQENWLRPLLTKAETVLTLETGNLDTLLSRLLDHRLDVVLANESVPSDRERQFYCRLLESQPVVLVGAAAKWSPDSVRLPEALDGVDMALPGPGSTVRGMFDAWCAARHVRPKVRAEVDDMAMLRLVARDSGWLTLVPEVVVQDELASGALLRLGRVPNVFEHFYAITTRHEHRLKLLAALFRQ